MLNTHQLWLFKNVIEYGGFTAAAEKLHISQPSISIQIKRLEKQFNVDLFERYGKKLQLTQAGEELYQYACKIVHLTEEAKQSISSLQDMKGAKLRIGASTTPGVYLLPSIAADFRRKYPGIEVAIEIANTRTIEEKLLDNSIDFAVLGEEQKYDNNLIIEHFIQDRLVAICGNEHELANGKKINLKMLAEQQVVLREKGSSTRDIVDNLLENSQLSFKEIWQLPSTESIKQVIMANWGVSILSYFSVRAEVSAGFLIVVPFQEEASLCRSINIAYHRLKKFSPAVQAFYHFLKETHIK